MQAIVVAVGVLIDAEGRVLVARRAPDAHQGSLWEFPGGKVEAHESVGDALKRELEEELGIQVEGSEPLMAVEHDYGDKHVRLDVHRVMRWQGEPRGLDGQALKWVQPTRLRDLDMPPADEPLIALIRDFLG